MATTRVLEKGEELTRREQPPQPMQPQSSNEPQTPLINEAQPIQTTQTQQQTIPKPMQATQPTQPMQPIEQPQQQEQQQASPQVLTPSPVSQTDVPLITHSQSVVATEFALLAHVKQELAGEDEIMILYDDNGGDITWESNHKECPKCLCWNPLTLIPLLFYSGFYYISCFWICYGRNAFRSCKNCKCCECCCTCCKPCCDCCQRCENRPVNPTLNTCYSYYYYDINDKYVKLNVRNIDTKELIVSPEPGNLGKIDNIKKISIKSAINDDDECCATHLCCMPECTTRCCNYTCNILCCCFTSNDDGKIQVIPFDTDEEKFFKEVKYKFGGNEYFSKAMDDKIKQFQKIGLNNLEILYKKYNNDQQLKIAGNDGTQTEIAKLV